MIILILAILGLALGSFVNALVWRLHEQAGPKAKKKDKKLSILNGRSMCVHCRHELVAADLIPLFSWLWLKGKCRYCGKPISWQYPAVELLTAVLFVFSYLYWPMSFNAHGITVFVFWLVNLVGLMALAVYDIRWSLLPDRIVYPLLYINLVQIVFLIIDATHHTSALGQILLSVAIGGGLFYLLFQFSGGKWIGGGDVKLGTAIGLILADPGLSFLMIFLASILGTFFSLPMIAANKLSKTSRIPFGPFLIASTVIVRLFGATMIARYKQFVGL